ncbi:uncharacterized protein TNIN_293121 [Trichonephila inaurata madagascariensis]|uniref:MULE transposase domain-containing protein n=1 Tax=Trichonephila inaurata madagascariensis TaxID=2747483 RepID=A0A8X6WTJ9_9ARAC|nr:uncharacterized protein TNIN_293121 [Trichonephila inaurata madagascariensis]
MTSIREQQEKIKITVEYQSVHAGHEMEVGKLNLHQDDRRDLAALLKTGVPSTKIIEGIQKKCLPTEQLGVLIKKDLHNLSQSFKLDETVLHTEDAISVNLQVKKMQRNSYDPILVYKPVGSSLANNPLIKKQDFILCIMTEALLELLQIYGKNIIMMDSTHGTNQYGYLLTTVMVSDDNHEGLPVAICYFNRVCSNILEPFFEELRNRLTHLQPKVFMPDDPAFWNAWKRVFGDVEYYVNLLCWNRNLNSKIKDPELRKEMGNKLKTLVSEIDELTFKCIYDDFIQKNEESKNFVKYLVKNYGGRK